MKMKMEIESKVYKVTVPVILYLGMKMNLHPSQAYCGIEEDIIEIVAIKHINELSENEKDDFLEFWGITMDMAREVEFVIQVFSEYEQKKWYVEPDMLLNLTTML